MQCFTGGPEANGQDFGKLLEPSQRLELLYSSVFEAASYKAREAYLDRHGEVEAVWISLDILERLDACHTGLVSAEALRWDRDELTRRADRISRSWRVLPFRRMG